MFNVYEFFNRINEVRPESRLDAGQPDIPVRREIIEEAVESLRRGRNRLHEYRRNKGAEGEDSRVRGGFGR